MASPASSPVGSDVLGSVESGLVAMLTTDITAVRPCSPVFTRT